MPLNDLDKKDYRETEGINEQSVWMIGFKIFYKKLLFFNYLKINFFILVKSLKASKDGSNMINNVNIYI